MDVRDAAIWVDSVTIEIQADGICRAHVRSGGTEIELRATIATGVDAFSEFQHAYAGHLARPPAHVAKFSRTTRERPHKR